MRTLTEKYLGGLPLKSEEYEADFEVVDKYQSFSSELLRLSLLGIAGYGFLIANVALKVRTNTDESTVNPFLEPRASWALIVGASVLGLSAAAALGHRYFSTDCITHFVRRLRLKKRCEELPQSNPDREKLIGIATHEQLSLERDAETCRWLLIASSLFLVIGAGCVALAFAFTIAGART